METQEDVNVVYLLIGSTAIMMLFIFIILLFFIISQKKKLKNTLLFEKQNSDHRLEMLHSMNETQEKERARIAHDIHDEVGAIFFMAKMTAGELARFASNDELKKQAEDTQNLISHGIVELKKSIQSLTPTMLEKLGFIDSIKKLVEMMKSSSSLNIQFIQDGQYIQLNDKAELALFRVSQELLNNALKYSKADLIEIKLIQTEEVLTLIISDDGVGFDINQKSKSLGLGLKNIESRIYLLNGNTEFSSTPGEGTYCIIEVPVKINS